MRARICPFDELVESEGGIVSTIVRVYIDMGHAEACFREGADGHHFRQGFRGRRWRRAHAAVIDWVSPVPRTITSASMLSKGCKLCDEVKLRLVIQSLALYRLMPI